MKQNIPSLGNSTQVSVYLSHQFGLPGVTNVILANVSMNPVAEVQEPVIEREKDVRDETLGENNYQELFNKPQNANFKGLSTVVSCLMNGIKINSKLHNNIPKDFMFWPRIFIDAFIFNMCLLHFCLMEGLR